MQTRNKSFINASKVAFVAIMRILYLIKLDDQTLQIDGNSKILVTVDNLQIILNTLRAQRF